eukprot:2127853-Pyramimonas_sp.AAC.2
MSSSGVASSMPRGQPPIPRVAGGRPSSCGGSASGASLAVPPCAGISANSSNYVISWSKPI